MPRPRKATVDDVHELALAMPRVTVEYGSGENPVYQVGGKSFISSAILDRTRSIRRQGSATRM